MLLLVGAGAGCATAPLAETHRSEAIDFPGNHYRVYYDAGIQTLREAGFAIDRQDYRFGRITAKPQGSPTVFEPWKPDNVDASDAWLSTLGDLRRRVSVTLEPADRDAPAQDDRPYRLKVEVVMERLQVPRRRLSGQTRGSVFADLEESPAEYRRRGIPPQYWQSVGRDPALEQDLLKKIVRHAEPAPRS